MARKYFIETFGCQMNFHDSERMAGLLEQAGYEPAANESEADLVVVNTCSVREHAEDKLYSRLGELRGIRRSDGDRPLVAVTGCVAQQEGQRLLRRSHAVDLVVGTGAEKRLPMLVEQAEASGERLVDINPHDDISFPLGLAVRGDPVKAYVTIIEGCNDFCAFCVVPYTRGHEVMRSRSEILEEVRQAVDQGRKEIQLLGQIVNHYQAPDDSACDFAGLLQAINEVPGVERIRFASPHPRHFTGRTIAAIRDLDRVCKHVHLPVQSGSSRVLTAMRRRYTREQYLDLVARLRDAVPGIPLSTDMIVGFPGETAEDFEETLSLVAEVRYHSMFSFKYSARPNTLAVKRLRDDVPEAEKGSRLGALQALQRDVQASLLSGLVGQEVEVLVDARSRRREWELSGRTSGNTIVNFPGPPELVGRLVRTRVVYAGPNAVRGELIDGGVSSSPA